MITRALTQGTYGTASALLCHGSDCRRAVVLLNNLQPRVTPAGQLGEVLAGAAKQRTLLLAAVTIKTGTQQGTGEPDASIARCNFGRLGCMILHPLRRFRGVLPRLHARQIGVELAEPPAGVVRGFGAGCKATVDLVDANGELVEVVTGGFRLQCG